MSNFKGISSDAIMLLAENRFNNSKEFYEANKSAIKSGIITPLSNFILDIAPTVEKINPEIITEPSRIISRVRRDTRFTKDKTLYRENLWFMLRHQKNELPTPTFWFEFTPSWYGYGCGILSGSPAFMQFWRDQIVAKKGEFLSAVKLAEKAGFLLDECKTYKKSKSEMDGITGELAKWYNLKEVFIINKHSGIAQLNRPEELIKEVCGGLNASAPLYKFLLSLTQQFNCGEI